MIEITLWQKIILYALLLISLFIFVKLSKLRIFNRPLISLKYRIILALFFPLILIVAFFLGSLIIAIILSVIFISFLLSFLSRKLRF